MKKLFLISFAAVVMLSTAAAASAAGRCRSARETAMSFRKEPGVEVVNLGWPLFGIVRTALRAAADDEEDRRALEVLKGIKRLTIVDCEDSPAETKARFLSKVRQALKGSDMLLEVRDSADRVGIYGTENNGRLRDLLLWCEDDYTLISIEGNLNLDMIDGLTASARKVRQTGSK